MNKNFEDEYKVYIQSEIPDLWDRIEKGIDEESAPVTQTAPITDFSTGKKHPSNKQSKKAWISLAVAACVCGVVIIPLALFGAFSRGSLSDKQENANFDCATAEECAVDEEYEAEGMAGFVSDTKNSITADAECAEADEAEVPENAEEPLMNVTHGSGADQNTEGLTDCPKALNVLVLIDSEEVAEEGIRYSFTVLEGETQELLIENQTAQAIMLPDQETPVVGKRYLVNLYWQSAELSSMPIYEMEIVSEQN